MSADELFKALDKDPDEALTLVRQLLNEGADINGFVETIQGMATNTPLTKAAQKQSPDIVELLLDRGAEIDALHAMGMTALMRAVTHGRIENCKVLLEHGAELSPRDYNGRSVLSLAVSNQHLAVVKLLLEHGIDINANCLHRGSALHSAVMIDHAEQRSIGGLKVQRVVETFSTTKLEIMRLLIDNGIDISAREVDEATALHAAARIGDIEPVKILLDAGADPNLMDDSNRKPLWHAVRANHVEIVKLLLGSMTEIDDQVFNGHTCLSTAARWRHRECVQLLLEAGADIWSQEPGPQFLEPERRLPWYGCDALLWAVHGDGEDDGDYEIVRMILAAGAGRQRESTADAEYSKWLDIWKRAQAEEMEEFQKWIASRLALNALPENDAMRREISKNIDSIREAKARDSGQELEFW